MAQNFSTGAVHCFIDNVGGQPIYLGTCESMPQDTRQPEYTPIMNDISGTSVPMDFAFEGESAQISLVLTWWNQIAALTLESKPNIGVSTPGTYTWNDVGSLMGLENYSVQLWLVYTFGSVLANKPVYVANGLPAGRHYPQCVVWAPETEEIGTAPMKRHFLFYAWPRLFPATRKFVLYDYNFTGISANLIQ